MNCLKSQVQNELQITRHYRFLKPHFTNLFYTTEFTMFRQITILGPGLLGASLAMAVKTHLLAQQVAIWDHEEELRIKCRNREWCDHVFETPEAAVENSEFVLVCTPVQTIVSLLKRIQPALAKDALVSDTGSTKAAICNAAQPIFEGSHATFIGAHPMTGSEKTGMDHARANLFENAACMLTPLPNSPTEKLEQLSAFWKSLKMRVSTASPQTHDRIVAHISHLPHVVASILCTYLSTKDETWRSLAGGGLQDTTRIAAGNPELWGQILEQNRDEILQSIEGFKAQLDVLKTALTENNSEELRSQLEQGKIYRDQF